MESDILRNIYAIIFLLLLIYYTEMVDAFGVFCKNMSTYNHYFSLHFIELFQTELGVALQGPLQQSYDCAFYFYFIHYSIFPLQVEKGHFRAGIHTGAAQIH